MIEGELEGVEWWYTSIMKCSLVQVVILVFGEEENNLREFLIVNIPI